MRNLTDIHNQLSAADQVYLEKRAEQIKIAEDEDAAGRIMARGFADELSKLAGEGYDLGNAGQSGQNYTGGKSKGRASGAAPSMPKIGPSTISKNTQTNPVTGVTSNKEIQMPPMNARRPAGGSPMAASPKPPGGAGGAMAMKTPKPPGQR